ncbi:sensor histidine kinase [Microscilla marina]|uniref:Signaling protein without kinase domain n=1 Tax=Microscilla marina ATCC 23134 TaxID=313606 RepID=A1ZXB6_MICM2|nr:histidine kinase [Microscilla marina]EAY24990.1 signaling protein without kinase domain [Microscilla marina ATCC 23134]
MNKPLSFVLNVNNRLYTHLLFWLVYYIYRVGLYIDVYDYTHFVQFFELFAKAFAVYLNLYVWMPYLLKKKRNFAYGVSLLGTLLVAGVIQTEVVRQMMRAGIYTKFELSLYSVHKIFSMVTNIAVVVGYTSLIKILKSSYQNQQINQQLKQERLENELKFLKSQINPHFLFNSLNNLYSLILWQSDKAKDVVLKISDLLSYMLYETNQEMVPLEKDIKYLKGFIELEKLRFGDELTAVFTTHGTFDEVHIPPMLLLPLVENAFKHSVGNGDDPVNISMQLRYANTQLIFEVENSIVAPPSEATHTETVHNSGIGLHNVRRRLELLYPNRHTLTTKPSPTSYWVRMEIDLSHKTNA